LREIHAPVNSSGGSPGFGTPTQPAYPDLDELRHRIRRWTDYNQTSLDMNLGGEAASEYDTAALPDAISEHGLDWPPAYGHIRRYGSDGA
jgi:hypothetical protein